MLRSVRCGSWRMEVAIVTRPEAAYRSIVNWYRNNSVKMERTQMGEVYESFSRKLLTALPDSDKALSSDMCCVAWQVQHGLLVWGAGYSDSQGVTMAEHGKCIETALHGWEGAARSSSLNEIYEQYLRDRPLVE